MTAPPTYAPMNTSDLEKLAVKYDALASGYEKVTSPPTETIREYRLIARALRASARAPSGVDREPTEAEVNSACMSYRHDFGIVSAEERSMLQFQAREWLHAWRKEGLTFAGLLNAPQSDGWRDIESAPKDWSSVILYDPEVCDAGFQGYYSCADGGRDCWMEDRGMGSEVVHPTHWMPLPDRPLPVASYHGNSGGDDHA